MFIKKSEYLKMKRRLETAEGNAEFSKKLYEAANAEIEALKEALKTREGLAKINDEYREQAEKYSTLYFDELIKRFHMSVIIEKLEAKIKILQEEGGVICG